MSKLKIPTAEQIIKYVILIFSLFVSIMPVLWIIFAAFKTNMQIYENPFSFPPNLYLENFKTAWTQGRMGRYSLNSVIVAIPATSLAVFTSLLAGFGFSKLKFYGQRVFYFIIIIGLMMPTQAYIIPLFFTVIKYNLTNTYMGMILPRAAFGLPFSIFFANSFFLDIPDELIDSAKMDGTNNFQIFFKLMLPLSKPVVSTLIVLNFIWSWNELLIPLLFVFKDKMRTLPLGLMYFKGDYMIDYALTAAAVAISMVPIIIIYVIFQRKFIQGLTSGALKG